MSIWELFWLVILAAACMAGGALFFRGRVEPEPSRTVRANDFTDQKLIQAAKEALAGAKIEGQPDEDAETLLEELARHAVGKKYAELYPGTKVEVSEVWPDAKCVLIGNVVACRLWVGYSVDRNGIKAFTAEVRRSIPLKLDGKRPIRAALDEMHAPPPKQADKPSQAPRPVRKGLQR